MYAPPPWLIALGAILTGAATTLALWGWAWSRERSRIAVASIAAVLAFLVWRAALIIANGANLDVDYDVLLGLSFEDIGTGVMAFLFVAIALGLGRDRDAPAARVVTSAGLAALAATFVDRFV